MITDYAEGDPFESFEIYVIHSRKTSGGEIARRAGGKHALG
jgi:hypothetical protein